MLQLANSLSQDICPYVQMFWKASTFDQDMCAWRNMSAYGGDGPFLETDCPTSTTCSIRNPDCHHCIYSGVYFESHHATNHIDIQSMLI